MSDAVTRARLEAMSAVFTVTDVGASLRFYKDRRVCELLGGAAGRPRHAIVYRDAVSLHLQAASRTPEGQADCGRASIYVFVESVDALHVELAQSGCAGLTPPTDHFHG